MSSSYRTRRKDDNSENWEAWKNEARYARLRTIVFSIIASGLVSLFIGYEIETGSYNKTARSAQQNCLLTQQVGQTLVEITGDVSQQSTDPAVKLRWASFQTKFRSTVPPTAAICKQVFPLRSRLPFID
jgi:hypothetical protein